MACPIRDKLDVNKPSHHRKPSHFRVHYVRQPPPPTLLVKVPPPPPPPPPFFQPPPPPPERRQRQHQTKTRPR
ncbi:hypothetical protein E2C01_071737 [Portunus trituberculatus]|uniref:Uncharacterized protein n=1 Tax=Portunus trituberculatus TaxID=210409 RepID=A0A5B7I5U7_PORTR|nr:hypothetical protein [Portunus trituberculatus]